MLDVVLVKEDDSFDATKVTQTGIVVEAKSGGCFFVSCKNGDEKLFPNEGIHWFILNSLHPCSARHVNACFGRVVTGTFQFTPRPYPRK